MISISAVRYLNTLPFIYGIENSTLYKEIELSLDFPAVCANKLLQGDVDLALVPTACIEDIKNHNIISDYCIGSDGSVETVSLYSNVPIFEVETIFLDYQSRTSIELLKILLRDYWHISPKLIQAKVGFEEEVMNKDAALIIGDRAFKYNNYYKYIYDLSLAWKQLTGLPFVFAVWVANKNLSIKFIDEFNLALQSGVDNIEEVLKLQKLASIDCKDPANYLFNKISYILDSQKKKAMDLFLEKIIE